MYGFGTVNPSEAHHEHVVGPSVGVAIMVAILSVAANTLGC